MPLNTTVPTTIQVYHEASQDPLRDGNEWGARHPLSLHKGGPEVSIATNYMVSHFGRLDLGFFLPVEPPIYQWFKTLKGW